MNTFKKQTSKLSLSAKWRSPPARARARLLPAPYDDGITYFTSMTAASESDHLIDHEDSPMQPIDITTRVECYFMGKETFEIEPLRERKKPAPTSWLWLTAKSAVLLTFSPLLLMGTAMFSTVMFIGPRWLQHRILSIMIPRIMKCQAKMFRRERKSLLAGIEQGQSVLDVGCGGGAYLKHYVKASHIVALEPVVDMHDEIQSVAQEVGISNDQLTLLPCTVEDYVQQQNEDGNTAQFDWIILGNVLCEVDDQRSTLESVNTLTKSGGFVYFSEHEGAPIGTWARRMEDLMNPWWVTVSGGCNCNRDTLQTIHSVLTRAEWEIAVWRYPTLKVGLGPSFLAWARKK